MCMKKFEEMLNNKLQEAGFSMKKDFMRAFNLSAHAIRLNHLTEETIKRYIAFFDWAIKAHKLDQIEKLTQENENLKKEIARLKQEK